MVRVTFFLLVLASALDAQTKADLQFKEAGVCARCHVISVVEWGLSGHLKAGTNCVACHGASQGHVIDERNNVKPERLPRQAAIAGLCATCHASGCPKSKKTEGCQSCHHVHALVDPAKPPSGKDEGLAALTARWQSADRNRTEAEGLLKAGQWEQARAAFRRVLADKPGDLRAQEAIALCDRQLHPALPGFEPAGALDEPTGLPREVKVAGLNIQMVLVPGGDVELGSDMFAVAKPIHSVHIAPFYLAKFEMSQSEWKSLTGDNPSAKKDDRLPVEQISWRDVQEMLRKLNAAVPGGGFRLPTEAEWEYAARAGGSVSDLRFGVTANGGAPRAVTEGAPNRFGLYNLQGNVWEWCSSLYAPYPYDESDGREDTQAAGLRVLRGGGFADGRDLLDPSMRHSERPDRKLRWNGVRIARTVPAP